MSQIDSRQIRESSRSVRTRPGDRLPCESCFDAVKWDRSDAPKGDGREEALLKHLQSLPSLSTEATKDLSLHDRSQRVLEAIHEFGKGENRYLMSVGETKGKQVEALIRDKRPKVGGGRPTVAGEA